MFIRPREELLTPDLLNPGVHAAHWRVYQMYFTAACILLTNSQVFGRGKRKRTFVTKGADVFIVGGLELRMNGLRHDKR